MAFSVVKYVPGPVYELSVPSVALESDDEESTLPVGSAAVPSETKPKDG